MTSIWQIFLATIPAVATYFLGIACFMLAERLFPAEKNQPWKNQLLSAQCTLLYFFATPFAMIGPNYLAAEIAKANGSLFSANLDLITTGSAAIDWPLRNLVLVFAPIFVSDFFYYWHHRLQHKLAFLWPQHKLHHMEESLCCLTDQRHHWLEDAIRVFTITIPMHLFITLTPVQGAFITTMIAYWSRFFHSNLRLPLGFLTPVLVGPQLHRIHHSKEAHHLNKNFAAFFPLWDILFGTYYRPEPGEWPATGLTSGETVTNLWSAAILPFREWARPLRALLPSHRR